MGLWGLKSCGSEWAQPIDGPPCRVLFQSGMLIFQITSPSTQLALRKRTKTLTRDPKVSKRADGSNATLFVICLETDINSYIKKNQPLSHS